MAQIGVLARTNTSVRSAPHLALEWSRRRDEALPTTYDFGDDRELDRFVPRDLAQLFCSGDCVITSDFSALEPGVIARKYYAPQVGLFLEVKPDAGEIVPPTECNFDRRV